MRPVDARSIFGIIILSIALWVLVIETFNSLANINWKAIL